VIRRRSSPSGCALRCSIASLLPSRPPELWAAARARAIDAARSNNDRWGPACRGAIRVKNLFECGMALRTLAARRSPRPAAAGPANANPDRAAGRSRRQSCWVRSTWANTPNELHRSRHIHCWLLAHAHDVGSHGPAARRALGRCSAGGLIPLAARLRHQRLDPGARFSMRSVRAQAHLWAALCGRAAFRSWRSLDIWGRWRRRAQDLALAYDAMQGPPPDPYNPACADRAVRAGGRRTLGRGIDGSPSAVAGALFSRLARARSFVQSTRSGGKRARRHRDIRAAWQAARDAPPARLCYHCEPKGRRSSRSAAHPGRTISIPRSATT